jgi:ABC-type nitrate/sulfonate/bicarbonate transport system substrate-binding protein
VTIVVDAKPRVLPLNLTRPVIPTALSLAALRGAFESECGHIRVELRRLNPEEPACGSEGIRETDGITALLELADDGDRRLIGLTWTQEFRALIALPAARIRSVRDMRNRRVGLPSGRRYARACALHVTTVALEANGLGEHDVEWVDIQHSSVRAEDGASDAMLPGCPREYASAIAALAAGKVHVAQVQGLRGMQAMRSCGAHAFFVLNDHPDPSVRVHSVVPAVMSVDHVLAGRSADLIAQVLVCARSNGIWAKSHEREVSRSVAHEFGAPEADVRATFGRELHKQLVPEISDSLIAALERLQQTLVRRNLLVARAPLRSVIDPEPLAAAVRMRR